MWNYEKRLQYPVNIKEPNAKLAMAIATQYGGPYCHIDQWNCIINFDIKCSTVVSYNDMIILKHHVANNINFT